MNGGNIFICIDGLLRRYDPGSYPGAHETSCRSYSADESELPIEYRICRHFLRGTEDREGSDPREQNFGRYREAEHEKLRIEVPKLVGSTLGEAA